MQVSRPLNTEGSMRIAPDHPRLRIVAVVCWALGAWLIIQSPRVDLLNQQRLFTAASFIAAILFFAVGIAFWLLGTDQRAGVVFDSKGLMLNLGHSAAFIGWDNIAAVGISGRRRSLLALGSRSQLGIRLQRPHEYIQSYETRLPASRSVLAVPVRLIRRLLMPFAGPAPIPTLAALEAQRRHTGYDVLIPEAQLGGRADTFCAMVETYRANPAQRRTLQVQSLQASHKPGI
jgi:hypothetical protein